MPPSHDPDDLLTSEEVAKILRKPVTSIWSDSSRAPERLPPRVHIPNSRKMYWRRGTVMAWLAQNEEPLPPPHVPAKRGRPPKNNQSSEV